jgi:Kdo2-lipid IVA lauroyltransferase/acyltransferase
VKPAITPGSWFQRIVVGVVLRLVRSFPSTLRRGLALGVAGLAWHLRIRRSVAVSNLQHAFPQWLQAQHLQTAREVYAQLALTALEAVTSDLVPDAQLEATVRVPDWRGLDVLLAQRQPVLLASAHFGSWELLAEVMSRRGVPLSAVVRPLAGAFNEWVVKMRRGAGLELILQRGALQNMLKALKRGRAVVQLVDQVLSADAGVFVPFFGRLASTTPALSMAALRSGAPVYLVLAERMADGHFVMHVEGPFPMPPGADRRAQVQAHAALLTERLESHIRRVPAQWLWLHRRWKVQPPEA